MKVQRNVTIITISVFVCVAGLLCYLKQGQVADSKEEVLISGVLAQEKMKASDTPQVSEDEKKSGIFVHVCGAVKKAGVYELKDGARICDAIKAAGGFKKTANQTFLNQAQILADGEQVVVPAKDETEKNPVSAEEGTDTKNIQKISINHGTCQELMTLPGIGEAKANSIIKYREENGGFQALEDLKKIQGIKDGVYSKIADYIML